MNGLLCLFIGPLTKHCGRGHPSLHGEWGLFVKKHKNLLKYKATIGIMMEGVLPWR
jgi:hypothetical protein